MLAAAGALVVALVLANLLFVSRGREAASPTRSSDVPVTAESPQPTTPLPHEGDLRSYALALPELDGLPPDLQPGDRLQLWVAWEPPVTRTSQVQLLVKGATFDRIVSSVVPGEPPTVLLLVSPKDIPDLLYGDRWGALSAVVLDA